MSLLSLPRLCLFFFFFNDTATTEIYTLSLHDALPIFAPSLCTTCSPGPSCSSWCWLFTGCSREWTRTSLPVWYFLGCEPSPSFAPSETLPSALPRNTAAIEIRKAVIVEISPLHQLTH